MREKINKEEKKRESQERKVENLQRRVPNSVVAHSAKKTPEKKEIMVEQQY